MVKFAPGSAIGNTRTIIASGNRAIRYCLIPNKFMYWVANFCPPSNNEKPTRPPVTIMMME
ncbi:hypothetical protein D3C78_1496870 [compost metagenome]